MVFLNVVQYQIGKTGGWSWYQVGQTLGRERTVAISSHAGMGAIVGNSKQSTGSVFQKKLRIDQNLERKGRWTKYQE